MMKQATSLAQTLHDVLVRMAAQAVILLSPSGKIIEHAGGIKGLDEEALGVLLAQSMSAFQHLIAKGQQQQIFFAYQDAYYHYAGTGTYRSPFLVSIFQSQLHRPPALGTTKFCVKRAYNHIGLEGADEETLPDEAPSQSEALSQSSLLAVFPRTAGADTLQVVPDLHEALEETAQELQARLLLAVDESGTVVDAVGESDRFNVAEIGALAAGSLAAFAEASALAAQQPPEDAQAMVVLEGPQGVILLARDEGPLAFLAILPPNGFLGMARLMLKDLLRREWDVVQSAWDDFHIPLPIEEIPLADIWAKPEDAA